MERWDEVGGIPWKKILLLDLSFISTAPHRTTIQGKSEQAGG